MTPSEIIMPDRKYKGYIFDCDGTLADTMPLHFRAWAQAVEEGGEFSEDLFYQWGGRPGTQIVEDLNRTLGLHLEIEPTVERKENHFLSLLHEVRAIHPVVNIARRLHGQAILAVTSGGYRKYVELTLDAISTRELFEVIVCAEDYSSGKPHPEPFLETARRMAVSPEDCLVFEDSPAGIESARRAGMDCMCVPSGKMSAPYSRDGGLRILV